MNLDLSVSASAEAKGNISPAQQQKLHRSAREFEAMLLTSLWKEEQASVQENEAEDGDDTLGGMKSPLQDLAFQSIALKAADSKGFGIARMIEHSLQAKLAGGHDLSTSEKTLPSKDIGAVHAYSGDSTASDASRN